MTKLRDEDVMKGARDIAKIIEAIDEVKPPKQKKQRDHGKITFYLMLFSSLIGIPILILFIWLNEVYSL